jgi:cell division cycle 14
LLQESDRRRAQAQAAAAGSAVSQSSSSSATPPAPIRVYHYCTPTPQLVANAAALAGIFQVMCLGRSADAACAAVAPAGPFMPFRDASCGAPCFALTVDHVIRGVAKARDAKLLDVRPVSRLYVPASPQDPSLSEQQRLLEKKQRALASPAATAFLSSARGPSRASATCAAVATSWHMDVAEYEHYERVENGDANWILPGKILAFSGPASRSDEYPGFRAMTPEDYFSYFAARGVTAVVRLNRSAYEGRRFASGGFAHHELYFPDGSCPPAPLLARFLALAEAEPGAVAVHCKAGLGRTGVLACAYLMKHYGFKAEEALGYIRVVRPGSVIGPQQLFLGEIEPRMHAQGRAWRAAERKTARREEKKMMMAGALAVGSGVGGKAEARVPPPLPVWGPAQGFEGLPVVAGGGNSGLAPAGGMARPQGRAAPAANVWAESGEEEEDDDWSDEAGDEAADAVEEADLAARRAAERDAAAAMVRAMALGAPPAAGASSATVTVLAAPKKAASASAGGANKASSAAAQQQGPSSSLASTLLSPRSAAAAAAGGIGASIGSAVSSLLMAAAGARASASAPAPPPPASPLTSGVRALGSKGGAATTSAGGALAASPDSWKSAGGGSSLGGSAAAPPSPAAAAAPATPAAVVRVLAPNGQPRKVPASMLAGAQNGVLAASIALIMGEEEGPAPAPAAAAAPAVGVTTRSAAAGRR